jgi:hypothetical protein
MLSPDQRSGFRKLAPLLLESYASKDAIAPLEMAYTILRNCRAHGIPAGNPLKSWTVAALSHAHAEPRAQASDWACMSALFFSRCLSDAGALSHRAGRVLGRDGVLNALDQDVELTHIREDAAGRRIGYWRPAGGRPASATFSPPSDIDIRYRVPIQ